MFDTMSNEQSTNLDSLCATYDVLLSAPETSLSDEAERELRAMAKIFDLEADSAPAHIWSRLRNVLIKQAPVEAEVEVDTPLTLLVVEDDAEAATQLVETLSNAGHGIVGPFHSAEAAEAAAALHVLDAALLDINLSGPATGIELARKLKSRWGTPVVFLSGDVTAAARHEDVADAMVIKPYSGRDVLGALRRISDAR